jgi:hypothetical protein
MATLDQKQPIEEGAIGAAIGGGLGGLAGSALGPLGIVGGAAAGAALGSKAGDFLSNILNPSSLTSTSNVAVKKDSSSSTGFANATTGEPVIPSKKGFFSSTKADDADVDDLGNAAGSYSRYPQMIFSASTSLTSGGGEFAKLLTQVEQDRMDTWGAPITVRGTWDFNGAALSVMERDQGFQDKWYDWSALATAGPSDERFYNKIGYKLDGGVNASSTRTQLGGAATYVENYKTSQGQAVVKSEITQLIAFTQPSGKPGMHLLMVQFLGPTEVWQNGGKAALKDLANSITLKGVKQLKG